MQAFTKLTGVAAPLELANIDTDKIIPARFLRKLRGANYQKLAFHDIRYDADGKDRADFVLNQAPYRDAKILVAGANFGCGSSREAAVYVMWDYGIRSVIAPSFGDIHYGNELQNGMLPVILPDATCQKLRQPRQRFVVLLLERLDFPDVLHNETNVVEPLQQTLFVRGIYFEAVGRSVRSRHRL